MVTIGDVAKAAGVSRSTASYALSGKRAISDEVRLRVEDAVKNLGYTPNAGARALATSQTMVLALLAQFLPDEFAPAMLQYIMGVSDTARELGYDILLVTDEEQTSALERITRSRMVDGVVMLNVAETDERLPLLRAARQPAALVGLPHDCTGVDVFDLDFEEAGRMMVEHLHRLGHRELILISQPEHVLERGGAYVWRLQDAAVEQAKLRGIVLHTVFGWTEGLLIAWMPVYLLLMQKRVYAQGWPMTLLKYCVLGFCYSFLLGFAIAASMVIGLVAM